MKIDYEKGLEDGNYKKSENSDKLNARIINYIKGDWIIMLDINRAIIIVLDGFGVGEAPDADKYGDIRE